LWGEGGICRISEGCNGFLLPENFTNTALGCVPFHTLIINAYCNAIFTDISVGYSMFCCRVLSTSSVLQCHNYGYLFFFGMFHAVQFNHPLLCHNATNTSVVRNVSRSTISLPTSVLGYQDYGYLFVRNVFSSKISSPTSVSQCDEYLCSLECFPQYNFITQFCVTMRRIPL